MTNEEIVKSIFTNAEIIRKTLPYKTGNLQNNAYKIKKIDDTHFDVTIDLSIAPYAEYINNPGYRTAGYWQFAMLKLMNLIADETGGTLE